MAAGARLEWLPLETLVHSGALADNRMRFDLAPGAEMFGWDCVALGLPAADAPFVAGDYRHDIAVGPRWLERGRTSAADAALLDGPAAGPATARSARCGSPPARRWPTRGARRCSTRRARSPAPTRWPRPRARRRRSPTSSRCACWRRASSRSHELLASVWRAWRALAWGRDACAPRVWRT